MLIVLAALVLLTAAVGALWFAVGRTERAGATLASLQPEQWLDPVGELRRVTDELSDTVGARERR